MAEHVLSNIFLLANRFSQFYAASELFIPEMIMCSVVCCDWLLDERTKVVESARNVQRKLSFFGSCVFGYPLRFWSRTDLSSKNFLCHLRMVSLECGGIRYSRYYFRGTLGDLMRLEEPIITTNIRSLFFNANKSYLSPYASSYVCWT